MPIELIDLLTNNKFTSEDGDCANHASFASKK